MAAHQAPPSLGFSTQECWSGCHFLLQFMKVKSESEVPQSCPTLPNPGCNPRLLHLLHWIYHCITSLTLAPLAAAAKSLVSNSVRPHRRQPTRLPRPWDCSGKSTGVGCHFLLQFMKVKSESEVDQSCPTLSDHMDCSLPGSSVYGFPGKSTGVGCHCLL